MLINQNGIIDFIKVRGGVINLRELSHFNRKDIEALQLEGYIKVGRGSSGIEVTLLDKFTKKYDGIAAKEEVRKHHQVIENKLVEKKKSKRDANDFSLKNKIFSVIKNADYPVTASEIKEQLIQCNPDSICAYLSALVKVGIIVCSENRKMFRHYTTPDRKELLAGLNRKPKKPKPDPIPVPATAAALKEKLATAKDINLKHKVLKIVVDSDSPMTLQQVRSLLPESTNIKTISAYLSLFARKGILCCSRVTKNNIKYYTTPDRSHLFGDWTPRPGSQKVAERILSVLENTSIALGIRGISAQSQIPRKSAWVVIHKLKNKGLIELKRTGYSLHIALKSNSSAMDSLNKVSGYTLRDQVIESIKNNNHHAQSILSDLINDYSLPHIHRVLRQMKSTGVLYSRTKGRHTLYFLNN
jgi:Fe2+ or Zn2+ uptake regulation protein